MGAVTSLRPEAAITGIETALEIAWAAASVGAARSIAPWTPPLAKNRFDKETYTTHVIYMRKSTTGRRKQKAVEEGEQRYKGDKRANPANQIKRKNEARHTTVQATGLISSSTLFASVRKTP